MNLDIEEHASLKTMNTMRLDSVARYFGRVESLAALQDALLFANKLHLPIIPLGEGSNVVLGEFLEALVLLIRLKGREITERRHGTALIRAGAGEHWHSLVCWSLEQGLYGLEKLALIPGYVGAAPIQNLGAYGVELKDCFVNLEAVDRQTGEMITLSAEDCAFGYRDSVFKNHLIDRLIITSVTLRLDETVVPELNCDALRKKAADFAGKGKELTGMDICRAVCAIRREKLPDPELMGNVGSFFKNPIVSNEHKIMLQNRFSDMPVYRVAGGWKLAAAWLIDQCGFKGCLKRKGGAGVYEKQALVIVNHGDACRKDILILAEEIRVAVEERFAVALEVEPRIY